VSPHEASIDEKALRRRVYCLPSGFDFQRWREFREEAAESTRTDSFTVLYAGRLIPGVRDPSTFLEGLRSFLNRQPGARVRFACAGPSGDEFLAMAREYGIESIFEDYGDVPVSHAQMMMCRADLLLLLSPVSGESGVPGGKLYEYLAAGAPIVATPSSDQYVADILKESQAGDAASTAREVADVLSRRYRDWAESRAPVRAMDDLVAFTWETRGRQLSELLDELLSPQSAAGVAGEVHASDLTELGTLTPRI
jgi:glycosyltransferase involved in cell wall biosynthesis